MIFKTNRDVDSTIIVIGIHLLMGGVLFYHASGQNDMSSILNNLFIIYGMIASYFFKSQQKQNGGEDK